MRSFAAAYGISAIVSSGWSLVTGLWGTGSATPSSARQSGSLRPFTWSFTGASFALKGRSLTSVSVVVMSWDCDRRIQRQRIVPLRCGIHLPVGSHASVPQLQPVFADPIREDQCPALHGDRVLEPLRHSRLKRKLDIDAIPWPSMFSRCAQRCPAPARAAA